MLQENMCTNFRVKYCTNATMLRENANLNKHSSSMDTMVFLVQPHKYTVGEPDKSPMSEIP